MKGSSAAVATSQTFAFQVMPLSRLVSAIIDLPAGLIHPGILACAPSAEVLATWNKREGELISANTLDVIVAQPPEPKNVHAGSADSTLSEKVGKEGARTIPGRPEHGGNCDIKNLSRGSKV